MRLSFCFVLAFRNGREGKPAIGRRRERGASYAHARNIQENTDVRGR